MLLSYLFWSTTYSKFRSYRDNIENLGLVWWADLLSLWAVLIVGFLWVFCCLWNSDEFYSDLSERFLRAVEIVFMIWAILKITFQTTLLFNFAMVWGWTIHKQIQASTHGVLAVHDLSDEKKPLIEPQYHYPIVYYIIFLSLYSYLAALIYLAIFHMEPRNYRDQLVGCTACIAAFIFFIILVYLLLQVEYWSHSCSGKPRKLGVTSISSDDGPVQHSDREV